MNQRTHPLFRAAPVPVLAEPTAPLTTETPIETSISDLTDYVGATVDASTWAALQAECARRYGDAWKLYADQVGDGYHVTELTAKPG